MYLYIPPAAYLLQIAAGAGLFAAVALLLYMYVTTVRDPPNERYESEYFFVDPNKNGMKMRFPSISDAPSIDLTVVVPSYNEEERLPVMLNECLEYLQDRQGSQPSFRYEVIIVDDGSRDKTSEVALLYSEKYSTDRVRVLTLVKNRGKGGAVRLGVMSARGSHILFADADGATKFSELSKLESQLPRDRSRTKAEGGDGPMTVVCGSRAHLEEVSIAQRSLFRTFLMKGFHILVWGLCVKTIRDTQCGYKLLTRAAAARLFSTLHVQRWAFDVELLYIAESLGIHLSEVAVTWQEVEGSKMTPVLSWLQMGRDLLFIRLRYALGLWRVDDKAKTN